MHRVGPLPGLSHHTRQPFDKRRGQWQRQPQAKSQRPKSRCRQRVGPPGTPLFVHIVPQLLHHGPIPAHPFQQLDDPKQSVRRGHRQIRDKGSAHALTRLPDPQWKFPNEILHQLQATEHVL